MSNESRRITAQICNAAVCTNSETISLFICEESEETREETIQEVLENVFFYFPFFFLFF